MQMEKTMSDQQQQDQEEAFRAITKLMVSQCVLEVAEFHKRAGLSHITTKHHLLVELSRAAAIIARGTLTAEKFGESMKKIFELCNSSPPEKKRIVFEFLVLGMTNEKLGYLPGFIDLDDTRPAREQFHANYKFGGWRPATGFKLREDNALCYPGDPILQPLAQAKLRDELIVVYNHDLVSIIQPDRTFEVARLD